MGPELAGGGVVHELARVARGHLKQHAVLQVPQRLPVEPAEDVGAVVAPDRRMHSDRGPFAKERDELLVDAAPLVVAKAVVVRFFQLAKAGQVINAEELCRADCSPASTRRVTSSASCLMIASASRACR